MADGPAEIRWSRKPYNVVYRDAKGDKKTIRRRPPKKLHEALPTDIVELTRKRNDHFKAGEAYAVKHINTRHPNVMQLEDEAGRTTFIDYYDMNIKEKVAFRRGQDPRDREENNEYLMWP